MFNFFKKQQQTNRQVSEEGTPPQALIIRSVFESGEDFGTREEIQALYELEDNLDEILTRHGFDLDGHDVGDSEFVLYAYGSNADGMLDLAKKALIKSPFVWFNITLRYGSVNDARAREKQLRINSKG